MTLRRRPLNPRERVLLGVIAVLLAGGAMVGYVVLPSYRAWVSARAGS